MAFLLTGIVATYTAAPGAAQSPIYTNVWGVEVVGGLGVANSVAIRHGLTNLRQVSSVFPVDSSPHYAASYIQDGFINQS